MLAFRQAVGCSSRVRLSKSVGFLNQQRLFTVNTVLREGNNSNHNGHEEARSQANNDHITTTEDDFKAILDSLNHDSPKSSSLGQASAPPSHQTPTTTTIEEDSASTSSYLDQLLSSDDAFQRDGFPSNRRRPEEDLLNREWGDDEGDFGGGEETRGSERRRQERALMRRSYMKEEQRKNGAKPYTGQLTPSEAHVFSDIFDKVWQTDSTGGAINNQQSGTAEGGERLFGNFSGQSDDQKMRSFYMKTIAQRARIKQQQGFTSSRGKNASGQEDNRFRDAINARSPSKATKMGIIRELIGSGGTEGEQEILRELDFARNQITACQSTHELWEWARENVWGLPSKQTLERRAAFRELQENVKESESEEGLNATESITSVEQDSSTSQPRFGVKSPTYAPVLRLLMKNFREKYRSPHSALNVLRIARNAGPESFVLGCTSIVYAEAIKTAWNVLRDLPLAYRIAKEAKEAGVLSSSSTTNTSRRSNPKTIISSRNTPSDQSLMEMETDELMQSLNDDSLIRSLMETIKADVRKLVYQTSKVLSSSRTKKAEVFLADDAAVNDEEEGNSTKSSRFFDFPLQHEQQSDPFTAITPTLLLEQFDLIEEMQKIIQPNKSSSKSRSQQSRRNNKQRSSSFSASRSIRPSRGKWTEQLKESLY